MESDRGGAMRKTAGVTLLEVLMAMLILGMVTGGIFTAFVFARQVSYRSTSQLVALGMMRGTAEQLRAGTISLTEGIDLDPDLHTLLGSPATIGNLSATDRTGLGIGAGAPASIPVRSNTNLALPADFKSRYIVDRYDGRIAFIEGNNDLNGDGKAGVDTDGNAATKELLRVQVKVRWTPPTP
jgi:type II secretory pathway pseudopilin PulG